MSKYATNEPTVYQISLDEFEAGKVTESQSRLSPPVQALHNLAPGKAVMIYHSNNPFSTLSSAASRLRTMGKADIQLKRVDSNNTAPWPLIEVLIDLLIRRKV